MAKQIILDKGTVEAIIEKLKEFKRNTFKTPGFSFNNVI